MTWVFPKTCCYRQWRAGPKHAWPACEHGPAPPCGLARPGAQLGSLWALSWRGARVAFCLRGLLPLCPAKVNPGPWCQAQKEAGLTQDLRQPGSGPSWVPRHAAGQSWSGIGVREGVPGVRSGPRDPVLVYGPQKALPVQSGPGQALCRWDLRGHGKPEWDREDRRRAHVVELAAHSSTRSPGAVPGGGRFELGTLHPGELLPEAERRWSPLAPRVAQEWAGQLERGQEGGPSASSRLPCRQAWHWRHKAFWAGNRATSTCPGGWGPHSAPRRPLLLTKWAGSTPWSDLGQEGSTGTEALGGRRVGGSLGTRLS